MRSKNKIVFVSLLIFCTINKSQVAAQSYIPIPDSNAYWLITDAMIWELFATDSVKNDTNINSLNYTKLFYLTGSWSNPTYNYVGGFRNDTVNKKTFFVPVDSLQEFLLYDFSANVGDTLSLIHRVPQWPSLPFPYQMQDLVVDSIIYKSIGPRNHMRIYLHDPQWPFISRVWTEGIGATNDKYGNCCHSGILPNTTTSGGYNLYCMSNNDTVYFFYDFYNPQMQDTGYFFGQCDTMSFLLSINESHSASDIEIFPSLVNLFIIVKSSNSNTFPLQIKIYNPLGVICKTWNITENGFLNISELLNGIYFLQIESKNKIIHSQKIIKQ